MIDGLAYSVQDQGGAFFMHNCSYEDATVVREGYHDTIWLSIDTEPFLRLPDSFNRIVICEDGEEIRSAVLRCTQIIALENAGVPEPGPLGETAPLLTINLQDNEVVWETPNGMVRTWSWDRSE
jgi:hypothetical protein